MSLSIPNHPFKATVWSWHGELDEFPSPDCIKAWNAKSGDLIENVDQSGYRMTGVSFIVCENDEWAIIDLDHHFDTYGTVPSIPQFANIARLHPLFWTNAEFNKAYWHTNAIPLLKLDIRSLLDNASHVTHNNNLYVYPYSNYLPFFVENAGQLDFELIMHLILDNSSADIITIEIIEVNTVHVLDFTDIIEEFLLNRHDVELEASHRFAGA